MHIGISIALDAIFYSLSYSFKTTFVVIKVNYNVIIHLIMNLLKWKPHSTGCSLAVFVPEYNTVPVNRTISNYFNGFAGILS